MLLTGNTCKYCQSDIDIRNAKYGVVECRYCGRHLTLPKKNQRGDVCTQLLIGNNALYCCDFNRAEKSFELASKLDPTEPEAYFGIALAEHGIKYLSHKETDGNGKIVYCKIPVSYRPQSELFSENKNYQTAFSKATEEQRKQYKKEAADIDHIQKEFRKLEREGNGYDVFICAKVSEIDEKIRGEKSGTKVFTNDHSHAVNMYTQLIKDGYRPFYSEMCIGSDIVGKDYEAHILYALCSAKAMLIVCFDEQYLKTQWVQNEYERYLSLMRTGMKEENSLVILYGDKVIERLPWKDGKLQGLSVSDSFTYDKLKKFINAAKKSAKEKAAEREAREKAASLDTEAKIREAEERIKKQTEESERKLQEEADALRKQLAEITAKAERLQKEKDNAAKAEAERLRQAEANRVKQEPLLKPTGRKDACGRELFTFGRYPQKFGTEEQQPIEWIKLKQEGNRVMLLSSKILDCVMYYDDYYEAQNWLTSENDYWKRSNIGYWLNGSAWEYGKPKRKQSKRADFFYDNAFSAEEKTAIAKTEAGKVFCLSLDEVKNTVLGTEEYDEKRRAVGTPRVLEHAEDGCDLYVYSGSYDGGYLTIDGKKQGCSPWWLRSPGSSVGCAAIVNFYGHVYVVGFLVNYILGGVRPALWLNL